VEWAIKSLEPSKVPGTDRIYPILNTERLGPLTKAFRASIALKYVPQAWGLLRYSLYPNLVEWPYQGQRLQTYQPYIFPTKKSADIG